jgi:hypothetical protein
LLFAQLMDPSLSSDSDRVLQLVPLLNFEPQAGGSAEEGAGKGVAMGGVAVQQQQPKTKTTNKTKMARLVLEAPFGCTFMASDEIMDVAPAAAAVGPTQAAQAAAAAAAAGMDGRYPALGSRQVQLDGATSPHSPSSSSSCSPSLLSAGAEVRAAGGGSCGGEGGSGGGGGGGRGGPGVLAAAAVRVAKATAAAHAQAVESLEGMGFAAAEAAVALKQCDNNVEQVYGLGS